MKQSPEQQTVRYLVGVMDGQHFSLSAEKTDVAKVKAWVLGVLRGFYWYRFCCKRLMKKADKRTLAYIMHAMFRLDDDPKSHAVLTNTLVEESKKLHLSGAMVNAVLRRYLQEKEALGVKARGVVSVQYNIRETLLDRIKESHDGWKDILRVMQKKPAICLVVNTNKASQEAFEKALDQRGLPYEKIKGAYLVHNAGRIQLLPGYDDGWFMVISASNQQTVDILPRAKPKRVLDACAAPGGKSFLLRQYYGPDVDIVATDSDDTRISRLVENNDRLHLGLDIKQVDWSLDQAMGGFDLIWADVPCSATGVIAKHPEIATSERDDLMNVPTQKTLLNNLWKALTPGGVLIYSTCSLLKEENDDIVQDFLSSALDAEIITGEAHPLLGSRHGRYFFNEQSRDVIYTAVIKKSAKS